MNKLYPIRVTKNYFDLYSKQYLSHGLSNICQVLLLLQLLCFVG